MYIIQQYFHPYNVRRNNSYRCFHYSSLIYHKNGYFLVNMQKQPAPILFECSILVCFCIPFSSYSTTSDNSGLLGIKTNSLFRCWIKIYLEPILLVGSWKLYSWKEYFCNIFHTQLINIRCYSKLWQKS